MDLFDLLKKFRASETEEEDASEYDVFEVKECWTARHWGVQVLTSVGVDIPADGDG